MKAIDEERVPLLFVDVNIEDGKTARIIVYEGEKSEDLALKFALEHSNSHHQLAVVTFPFFLTLIYLLSRFRCHHDRTFEGPP